MLAIVGLVAASAFGLRESRAAAGRIDGDLWARRNVELIRRELARADDPSVARATVLGFSIEMNPLLRRDPHAAEVAALAEAFLPRAGKDADSVRRVLALLRMPPAERSAMDRDKITAAFHPVPEDADEKPNPPDPGSIADRINKLPPDRRDALEPGLIAEMEAAARHPAGEGRLTACEWARYAMIAAEHRSFDAARRGFELANDAMKDDVILDPPHRAEKAGLVREAIAIDHYEIANDMHQTGSEPGAWARLMLAKAYRERGDAARAAALLDEALAIVSRPNSREGESMAGIAVELQKMGRPDRAERALLDSLARVHGEDFGLGGTLNIVDAAVAMGRVDLLDRLYDRGEVWERLLLCIMASSRSVTPDRPR